MGAIPFKTADCRHKKVMDDATPRHKKRQK